MPFLPSHPENAGPPAVFAEYPDIYGPWAQMSEALMNGPSPFTPGERELLLAFAAGAAGCDFVRTAHAEVAYAWGIEHGMVDRLLRDEQVAEPHWRPLLTYVRALAGAPETVTQANVDAILASGWDEHALHDAIAIVARAAFMHRMVAGHGFQTLDLEVAARHAARRVERGYVNLYAAFRADTGQEP